jgi:hypothetical protein
MLVTIFHLDHVSCLLRFAGARQISFVKLPRIAPVVLRPTHRLRSLRAVAASKVWLHTLLFG